MFKPAEIAGWVIAVIVVLVMGFVALHGHWHVVNKGALGTLAASGFLYL
ncbi:MAG TPA: hypothetical protein VFB58_00625 [Chloroflexota bacterium]|nr:hypothetical protein [Chloroflexota bacterium]